MDFESRGSFFLLEISIISTVVFSYGNEFESKLSTTMHKKIWRYGRYEEDMKKKQVDHNTTQIARGTTIRPPMYQ
jgi:hypothetical protein